MSFVSQLQNIKGKIPEDLNLLEVEKLAKFFDQKLKSKAEHRIILYPGADQIADTLKLPVQTVLDAILFFLQEIKHIIQGITILDCPEMNVHTELDKDDLIKIQFSNMATCYDKDNNPVLVKSAYRYLKDSIIIKQNPFSSLF